jgi:protocatechuate 3,4-dioxygenase, beta subunit
MKTNLFLSSLCSLVLVTGCAQDKSNPRIMVGCEGCELMLEGMPSAISWSTKINNNEEPGEPLIISGTIYKADGKTPAPGVVLYVYHTDAKGMYSPSPNQQSAKRHGHLRGWVKTDEQGRYQFTTIRPASYPSREAPQHIHPIIQEPNGTIYWVDEYLFDDDPLLSEREKQSQKKQGGPGIIHLTKDEKGIWMGQRNIILGMNVPN